MRIDTSPILVTGSHRSGSTWVGKVIESSGLTNYIVEPLNLGHQRNFNGFWFDNKVPKIWFPVINFLEEKKYLKGYDKIVAGRYNYIRLKPKSYKEFKYVTKLILKTKRDNRVLLKDPIALFSSGWIYENYKSKNIVLIRNPLAFISSLKKNNWTHDFNDFLVQDEFLKTNLPQFIDKIKEFCEKQPSIIDQGILFSNIFNFYILKLKEQYPNWYFVALEDIATSPMKEFRKMFKYLELDFNDKVCAYITETTNSKNNAERTNKNVHVLKRNSKESINNWQKRLTENEIKKIKNQTSEIYSNLLKAINEK